MSLITSEHPTFHGRAQYESELYQTAPVVGHVYPPAFLELPTFRAGPQTKFEWQDSGITAPEYIRRDIYEHQTAMLAEALATVATLQNKLKEVGHVHD